MRRSTNDGFTLIEALLAIAAIAVIAGVGISVFLPFQTRNDLRIAANTAAQSMRRAQLLSQAADGDTSWGVHAEAGSITMFKGTSFGARDSTFDETFAMPSTVTPSGSTDFVFAKFSGLPAATGTLTLTSLNGETRTISINAKGMVEY